MLPYGSFTRSAARVPDVNYVRDFSRTIVRKVASVLAEAPQGEFILNCAALAPGAFKTPLFCHAMRMIAERVDQSAWPHGEILTNLGLAGGRRFFVPIGKHDYVFGRPLLGLPERATFELARHLAIDCQAVLDVGANHGLFTLALRQDNGSLIPQSLHLFEPDELLFDRLRRNFATNHIEAEINNVAVSDRTGNQTFYRNLDDDFSGSLVEHFSPKHRVAPIRVPTITLSDYITKRELYNVGVKIDVEGAGEAVWNGVKDAIERVRWLIVEIIGPETRVRLNKKICAQSGWNAYYIKDYNLLHMSGSEDDSYSFYELPFYNWLFCPLTPAALALRLAGTPFQLSQNN